jgi:hypothetical protein
MLNLYFNVSTYLVINIKAEKAYSVEQALAKLFLAITLSF